MVTITSPTSNLTIQSNVQVVMKYLNVEKELNFYENVVM